MVKAKALVKNLSSSPSGCIGLALVLLVLVVAVFAPYIANHSPNQMTLQDRLVEPGSKDSDGEAYYLGTDSLGRDVFSRLVYGTRLSLIVGLGGMVISLVIGCLIGLVAGYTGGIVETILMRVTDVFLAFPFVLMALILLSALGGGVVTIIIVLGMVNWTNYARVVRAETMAVKQREFVEASHAIGNGNMFIILKHILPNVVAPIIVVSTFNIATNILAEASLSFLGLGVDPSIPSWGTMLAESRENLRNCPWCATYPGLAIMCCVLAINLLGDWLRDYLDPKLK